MFRLLIQELNFRRWSILGWGLGIGLFGFYIVVIFPTLIPLLDSMPDISEIAAFRIFGDMTMFTTFEGFVATKVFALLPIILGLYASLSAISTLAGEEESGILELTMSLPIRRWQLVMTKAVALALAVLLALVLVGVGLALGFILTESKLGVTPLTPSSLFVAAIAVWPVVMVYGMLALFFGAYLPTQKMAVSAISAVLVATYFIGNLAVYSESLDRFSFLIPFRYFDAFEAIRTGISWPNTVTMLAAAAGFLTLALLSFQKRDVTVGAWPWQRPRVQEG